MSEAMGEFNANISVTQQGIGKITQSLATFNMARDFFSNISEAFGGLTETGSANASRYENDYAGASAKEYTDFVYNEYRW